MPCEMAIDAPPRAASPMSIEDPVLAKVRTERAKMWSDIRSVEDGVVDEFHDFARMSDTEFLQHLHKQIQSVMGTNQALQEQMRHQSSVIKQLENDRNRKEKEWADVQACLKERKEVQDCLETKLQEAHCARLAEERQLRDNDIMLRSKFATLTKEKTRLEDLRRAEQRQMVDLRQTIEGLQKEALSLRLKQAEYETSDDWDHQSAGRSVMGGSRSSVCGNGAAVARALTTGHADQGRRSSAKELDEERRRGSATASMTTSSFGVGAFGTGSADMATSSRSFPVAGMGTTSNSLSPRQL